MDQEVCKERILSNDYMDVIITENRMGAFAGTPEEELCRQHLGAIYDCIYIPRGAEEMLSLSDFAYSMIPVCYTLMDESAMEQAGILRAQRNPALNLMGQNIMIGFIDTGIDYQNQVFRNLDGSTRIEAIWDQEIQSGTPPEGFLYGSEYTREMIDMALQAENPLTIVPSIDDNSHGTYVASLAAGGANVEQKFIGGAPEAIIAVVKAKQAKAYLKEHYIINPEAPCYQENDLMAGVRYLNELAAKKDVPLVICLAMGTNTGSHTGSSPLSGLLDTYGNFSNRVMVTATGNEADQRHHFSDRFTDLGEIKNAEFIVGEGVDGFTAELWASTPNMVTVSIISPTGEATAIALVRDKGVIEHDYVFDRTRVSIDHQLLVEKTGSELIFMRFANVSSGSWTIRVRAKNIADGEFHIWLPVKEFMTGEVYFVRPDPNTTITEPGNTASPLTSGYYNGTTKSSANSSGRGFTRMNGVKPDFVAPGMNVLGALPGNRFATRTGSCAGAAITAGASALLLQWALYIAKENDADSLLIKSYLILGCEQDSIYSYPNQEWGYGRLNLYNTFLKLSEY